MTARSKVAALPEDVRKELNRRIIESSFSNYLSHAEWVTELGHPMSHAAVHRHGSQLERKIEALRLSTETAIALVEGAPDDGGAVSDATLRMAQERLFQVMMASESGNLKDLASALRAVAESSRASTAIRAERRKALAEAADRADGAVKKAGLSKDTAAAIRAAIQGGES